MARQRGRSWAGVAGDVALTVAAVLGTVCILLVIAAALFDVRIILFSTGSMSPTIPAGSAALVRSIPAADVQVGDVVTVERPGQLPITHRVTGVEEIPDASPAARRITMRGDANAVDDPFRYDVTGVRLVVFAVPGIAPAVAALGNPWVLGALTIGATALVVVVFWPRRTHTHDEEGDDAAAGDAARPRRSRVRSGAGTAAALILVGASALAAPIRAEADEWESVVQGEVIRLVSIEDPRMGDLAPGSSASWQVGVSADAPAPGTLTVQLSSTGDAALALRYDVQACSVRWVDGTCPGADLLVPEQEIPLDGTARDILSMPADEQRWLRVLVTRPSGGDPDAAGAVDIEVRAIGAGDDVSTSPESPLTPGLPATGGAAPWLLGGLALVLLALGTGVTLRSRRPS